MNMMTVRFASASLWALASLPLAVWVSYGLTAYDNSLEAAGCPTRALLRTKMAELPATYNVKYVKTADNRFLPEILPKDEKEMGPEETIQYVGVAFGYATWWMRLNEADSTRAKISLGVWVLATMSACAPWVGLGIRSKREPTNGSCRPS